MAPSFYFILNHNSAGNTRKYMTFFTFTNFESKSPPRGGEFSDPALDSKNIVFNYFLLIVYEIAKISIRKDTLFFGVKLWREIYYDFFH